MSDSKIRVISDRIRDPGLRAKIKSFLSSFPWLSMGVFTAELIGSGYLAQTGWCKSAAAHMPLDRNGAPIPWLSYPAIHFLEQRLKGKSAGRSVFEYGSGNSTLWWSDKVRRVVSCEHDARWHQQFQSKVPGNVEYLWRGLEAGYAETIRQVQGPFDVVVIDGLERVACAESLAQGLETILTEDGIVVWDNSDRDDDKPGLDRLRELGFREVEFSGLGPIGRVAWSTTVFYRTGNFLGL
jgi:hypothetical protein